MSASGTFANVQAAINQWLTDGHMPPLKVDGIPGVKTDAEYDRLSLKAAAEHAQQLVAETVITGATQWPLEEDAGHFFGYPPTLVKMPVVYPMRIFDGGWKDVHTITCNAKVADSLRRIFEGFLRLYGTPEAIREAGLDVYDGCYNDRTVRGSTTKRSMHAYGAAIDINAEKWPLGSTVRMPDAVVEIIESEGCRYGGNYKGRKDPMHWEWCR